MCKFFHYIPAPLEELPSRLQASVGAVSVLEENLLGLGGGGVMELETEEDWLEELLSCLLVCPSVKRERENNTCTSTVNIQYQGGFVNRYQCEHATHMILC